MLLLLGRTWTNNVCLTIAQKHALFFFFFSFICLLIFLFVCSLFFMLANHLHYPGNRRQCWLSRETRLSVHPPPPTHTHTHTKSRPPVRPSFNTPVMDTLTLSARPSMLRAAYHYVPPAIPHVDTLTWSAPPPSRQQPITASLHQYPSQLQDTTDALPCHIHLPVCL